MSFLQGHVKLITSEWCSTFSHIRAAIFTEDAPFKFVAVELPGASSASLFCVADPGKRFTLSFATGASLPSRTLVLKRNSMQGGILSWDGNMRHRAVGFERRVAWRAVPVNRLQGTLTNIHTNIQADLHNTHRRSGCPSEMVRILERLRVIRNAIWGSERPGLLLERCVVSTVSGQICCG